MSDIFFLVVGIILFGIGLLLLAAKVMTYIKCTVPINATVVKLETESTFFRGVEHTHYRPVVRYVVDGKSYTEEAYFRTRRKTKYPVDSEMIMYYNPKNPEQMRFVGHLFPLPIGLVFLSPFMWVTLLYQLVYSGTAVRNAHKRKQEFFDFRNEKQNGTARSALKSERNRSGGLL